MHLGSQVPVARAETPDEWLEVQANYLEEAGDIAIEYGVPVFASGDIFDRWNEPVAFLNYLCWIAGQDRLLGSGRTNCIAGNHDLPNHQIAEVERSAYQGLINADLIRHIPPEGLNFGVGKTKFVAYGFSCGQYIEKADDSEHFNLAVIHDYVWSEESGKHPKAKPEQRYLEWWKRFKGLGYDAILFGDNHGTVWKEFQDPLWVPIFNPGAFIRRRVDERNHKPCVGILYSDGDTELRYLDTSKDKWRDTDPDTLRAIETAVENPEAFLNLLKVIGSTMFDFVAMLNKALKIETMSPMTRQVLTEILNEIKP